MLKTHLTTSLTKDVRIKQLVSMHEIVYTFETQQQPTSRYEYDARDRGRAVIDGMGTRL